MLELQNAICQLHYIVLVLFDMSAVFDTLDHSTIDMVSGWCSTVSAAALIQR